MARSKYIYLVYWRWGTDPVAAFTVKHEAVKYMRTAESDGPGLYMMRMRDGKECDMVRVDDVD